MPTLNHFWSGMGHFKVKWETSGVNNVETFLQAFETSWLENHSTWYEAFAPDAPSSRVPELKDWNLVPK